MALEVSRKEEDVVVANLVGDLLDAAPVLQELGLSEADPLAPQPVDRRKAGCLFEPPKEMALAQPTQLCKLARPP